MQHFTCIVAILVPVNIEMQSGETLSYSFHRVQRMTGQTIVSSYCDVWKQAWPPNAYLWVHVSFNDYLSIKTLKSVLYTYCKNLLHQI